MVQQSSPSKEVIKKLIEYFLRNGYFRVPDNERRKRETSSYKMGYEIRLVARSKKELAEIRKLLKAASLKPGKPFAKVNQWCQPIYGRAAMEQFQEWINKYG